MLGFIKINNVFMSSKIKDGLVPAGITTTDIADRKTSRHKV